MFRVRTNIGGSTIAKELWKHLSNKEMFYILGAVDLTDNCKVIFQGKGKLEVDCIDWNKFVGLTPSEKAAFHEKLSLIEVWVEKDPWS